MAPEVLVVGAGYAGVAAIDAFQAADRPVAVTWIAPDPYHEVKHEIHRAIRSPTIVEGLRIPRRTIASEDTRVLEDEVVAINPEDRTVALRDDGNRGYDYLLLTVGARTAFYGIPGLEAHAYLLERAADAVRIHEALRAMDAPRVLVGGGGLSGIQTAGEVAAMRSEADVTVVEALDTVLPRGDPPIQRAVAETLRAQGVTLRTGAPIVEATGETVVLEGEEAIPYDLLVWAGGVTEREIDHGETLARERNRIAADATLRTSDPRIFACGDAAVIDQPGGIAPASAQAAWQAAPVAARNVLAADRDAPLREWGYDEKGTLVSVGETALAYDVSGIPIAVFDGVPAVMLKKLVAMRWIATAGSYHRALGLWSEL